MSIGGIGTGGPTPIRGEPVAPAITTELEDLISLLTEIEKAQKGGYMPPQGDVQKLLSLVEVLSIQISNITELPGFPADIRSEINILFSTIRTNISQDPINFETTINMINQLSDVIKPFIK